MKVTRLTTSSAKMLFVGSIVLSGGSCFFPAAADVILPGDVPIAGASTRNWPQSGTGPSSSNPGGPVNSQSSPAQQETLTRGTQLQQRLEAIHIDSTPSQFNTTLPGITSNTPVAYGGFKRTGGIGIGYQDRTRYANTRDGVAGLVLSFGTPQTVGVDLIGNILDLTSGTGGGGFGDRTSLGFKIHRPINDTLAIAFGGEDVLIHHRTPDQFHSYFGVVTKQINLKADDRDAFSRLHLSLGVGNGRFQSEQDVFAGKHGLGIFGSAAVQATTAIRPFAEWTGQDLNLGVSFVPFKRVPIILTPALADVTHRAGNRTRFTLGAAYSFAY